MSVIEAVARKAIEAGEKIELARLGGEKAVYADSDWPRSGAFGDIAEVLLQDWSSLRDPNTAYEVIAAGFRENTDRDAFVHAADALAATPPPDLRRFVSELDRRVRDTGSQEILRTEAASALLRFAIADTQLKAVATAALYMLQDLKDDYAVAALSRLTAIAWEHFRDDALIVLLERREMCSQAAYERGVIGLGLALEGTDLKDIGASLLDAEHWFERALGADEDRRDAHVYLLLTRALEYLASLRPAPIAISEKLRLEALMRYRWDAPAAGREWVLPPHDAELEWIPLVDRLVCISQRLVEPSWFDVAGVLGNVLKVYVSVRAVRPGLPGIERVVKPAIEAAFIRERGLLAHLTQWLDQANSGDIDLSDARVLRQNIHARLRGDAGKASGTSATGQARSPKRSRPG